VSQIQGKNQCFSEVGSRERNSGLQNFGKKLKFTTMLTVYWHLGQ